ncbi:hypothetical protein CP10139811_1421 [Chlamydia ibidis]|uniref:Uncharacterized protein n=1 Tax=Chlamydia ibidis TaxID=1405396 RepID=S7J4G5_9CHLA|nr:hypothetical protein CP10139811_1421 [Chlamydia ibidis]
MKILALTWKPRIFTTKILHLTESHAFSLENPPFNQKSHIFSSKTPHLTWKLHIFSWKIPHLT